jgi:hypothetical protein
VALCGYCQGVKRSATHAVCAYMLYRPEGRKYKTSGHLSSRLTGILIPDISSIQRPLYICSLDAIGNGRATPPANLHLNTNNQSRLVIAAHVIHVQVNARTDGRVGGSLRHRRSHDCVYTTPFHISLGSCFSAGADKHQNLHRRDSQLCGSGTSSTRACMVGLVVDFVRSCHRDTG